MSTLIKVLIVDDSAFARSVITKRLAADPEIEVVGFAKDGLEAVAKVKELKPQVVTMDVTMPNLDGLAALERIMAECPTPVVMVSALTGEQSRSTIKALELGAVDFFLKPSVATPAGASGLKEDLVQKVKVAAGISRDKLGPGMHVNEHRKSPRPNSGNRTRKISNVLVIGASTGGPKALCQLLPLLPINLSAAILIVQHMPAGFTRSLAERLNQMSGLEVREATARDAPKPGLALVAPGGYHMKVNPRGEIELDQKPPVWGVRPSVDVTMESVVQVFGPMSLGVVLTGMGVDGAYGCSLIKAAGGRVAAEDESTCAVFGMPRSVIEGGHADVVLPLPQMAGEIVRMCSGLASRRKEILA